MQAQLLKPPMRLQPTRESEPRKAGNIRVLYIENDDDAAPLVLRRLQEDGFIVDRFSSITAAWQAVGPLSPERLNRVPWDVLLVDTAACGEEGPAYLRRLHAENITTPLIFLHANLSAADRISLLDHGADQVLDKLLAAKEVPSHVRALLRRQGRGNASIVQYDDVSANLGNQRVDRNGRLLSLTLLEYTLLVHFLQHPEEVLSRTRLYAACYDERFDGEARTMEVHIMNLRRKLEKHGPRVIHTSYGRGYVLCRWDSAAVQQRTN